MTDTENQNANRQEGNAVRKISVDYAEGVDYKYRDILNVFVGRGDVILEMGNLHRSVPNQATIGDRVAISLTTAYDFHARLGQALKEAQEVLQKEMAQSR